MQGLRMQSALVGLVLARMAWQCRGEIRSLHIAYYLDTTEHVSKNLTATSRLNRSLLHPHISPLRPSIIPVFIGSSNAARIQP